jgi:hypothetical protein
MRIDIDAREVFKLADDIRKATEGLPARVKSVVSRTGADVQRTMREDMAKSRSFRQVAPSITYDTRSGDGFSEAQVGPVTRGQVVGDLAHFAYFGGANGGGGTVRDPIDAALDEAPRFEKGIADLIDRIR